MLGAVEVTVGALKKALAQTTMVKEGFLEKAAHKLDLEDKEGRIQGRVFHLAGTAYTKGQELKRAWGTCPCG